MSVKIRMFFWVLSILTCSSVFAADKPVTPWHKAFDNPDFLENIAERKKEVAQSLKKRAIEIGGHTFHEWNKDQPSVVTTKSGLQYRVVSEGAGASPVSTDLVKVHYHGKLVNGDVFDSSVDRGEPSSFALNQVIKGWTEGLQLMKEGGKTRFYVPSTLAYGSRDMGKIKPHSSLVFDVELIKVYSLNLPNDVAGIRAFKISKMECGTPPGMPADKAAAVKIKDKAESYSACVRDYYKLATSQLEGLVRLASGGDEMRDAVLDSIKTGKQDLSTQLNPALGFMKRYQDMVAN